MKYLIRDNKGTTYDVVVSEDGYLESYKENAFDYSEILKRSPDYIDAYFQIKESLPSRFEVWKL